MTVTRTVPPSPLLDLGRVRHVNLSVPELYEHAIRASEGLVAHGGPLLVRTGQHTGRSPQDKYLVDVDDAHEGVAWGGFNRPITEERYDALRRRMIDHLADRELYVRDCYVGANPRWRRSVRAYTETAWASIFCSNLFRMPATADLAGFVPDFTIVDAPSFRADPERDGVRSETVILVHLGRQEILIGGTEYAGEMKKSCFTAS